MKFTKTSINQLMTSEGQKTVNTVSNVNCLSKDVLVIVISAITVSVTSITIVESWPDVLEDPMPFHSMPLPYWPTLSIWDLSCSWFMNGFLFDHKHGEPDCKNICILKSA